MSPSPRHIPNNNNILFSKVMSTRGNRASPPFRIEKETKKLFAFSYARLISSVIFGLDIRAFLCVGRINGDITAEPELK